MFIIYINTITNINIDFVKSFMGIKYRGPDDSSLITFSTDNLDNLNVMDKQLVNYTLSKNEIRNYKQYSFMLGYHRNFINDLTFNASQPFEDPINNKILTYPDLRERPLRKLICNGEIYNYQDLVNTNNFTDRDLTSTCDVEVILPIYIKYGIDETLNKIDGEFAFVLTENINTFQLDKLNVFVSRDYLGIKPLYYIKNSDNSIPLFFVSEIKALPMYIIQNTSYIISHFPPSTYWSFHTKEFVKYYSFDKFTDISKCISSTQPDSLLSIYTNIDNLITNSIISRMNTEKSVGILLSGGFDSSILLSVLLRYLTNTSYDFNKLHIFTIGDTLGGEDMDIYFSDELIDFFESKYNIIIHYHKININSIEILSSDIEKIIYHLETFDPHTVRESIPYYYLMKYINENTDVKIILSGNGINELCGYNQFSTDLTDDEFQRKSIFLLENMHKYNLLKTDKISNIFSLEVRYPFLQKDFIEYMLLLHPKLKRQGVYSNEHDPISKYIIRKSFSFKGETFLPENILWREHSGMINALTNFHLRLSIYIEQNLVTDNLFNTSLSTLLEEQSNNMAIFPKTKEEMYYRLIFRKLYTYRDNLITTFYE